MLALPFHLRNINKMLLTTTEEGAGEVAFLRKRKARVKPISDSSSLAVKEDFASREDK